MEDHVFDDEQLAFELQLSEIETFTSANQHDELYRLQLTELQDSLVTFETDLAFQLQLNEIEEQNTQTQFFENAQLQEGLQVQEAPQIQSEDSNEANVLVSTPPLCNHTNNIDANVAETNYILDGPDNIEDNTLHAIGTCDALINGNELPDNTESNKREIHESEKEELHQEGLTEESEASYSDVGSNDTFQFSPIELQNRNNFILEAEKIEGKSLLDIIVKKEDQLEENLDVIVKKENIIEKKEILGKEENLLFEIEEKNIKEEPRSDNESKNINEESSNLIKLPLKKLQIKIPVFNPTLQTAIKKYMSKSKETRDSIYNTPKSDVLIQKGKKNTEVVLSNCVENSENLISSCKDIDKDPSDQLYSNSMENIETSCSEQNKDNTNKDSIGLKQNVVGSTDIPCSPKQQISNCVKKNDIQSCASKPTLECTNNTVDPIYSKTLVSSVVEDGQLPCCSKQLKVKVESLDIDQSSHRRRSSRKKPLKLENDNKINLNEEISCSTVENIDVNETCEAGKQNEMRRRSSRQKGLQIKESKKKHLAYSLRSAVENNVNSLKVSKSTEKAKKYVAEVKIFDIVYSNNRKDIEGNARKSKRKQRKKKTVEAQVQEPVRENHISVPLGEKNANDNDEILQDRLIPDQEIDVEGQQKLKVLSDSITDVQQSPNISSYPITEGQYKPSVPSDLVTDNDTSEEDNEIGRAKKRKINKQSIKSIIKSSSESENNDTVLEKENTTDRDFGVQRHRKRTRSVTSVITPTSKSKPNEQLIRSYSHQNNVASSGSDSDVNKPKLKKVKKLYDSDSDSESRRSSRLKKKINMRNSFELPKSKEYLEEISPMKYEGSLANLKRVKISNNFIRGKHDYVTETVEDIMEEEEYSSFEDNFIDDSAYVQRLKKTKRTSSKNLSSSEEDVVTRKRKSKQKEISNDELEENDVKRSSRVLRSTIENNNALQRLKRAREAKTSLEERKKIRNELISSTDDSDTSILRVHDSDVDFIKSDHQNTDSESDDSYSSEFSDNDLFKPIKKIKAKLNRVEIDDSDDEDSEYLLSAEEKTFFDLVMQNNSCEIEQMILESKYLVGVKNKDDQSALHLCAMNNFHAILKTLIDNNGDCNLMDNNNLTPLAYAALNKHFNSFQHLLQSSNRKLIDEYNFNHLNGMNLLHLLLIPCPSKRDCSDDLLKCIQLIFDENEKDFFRLFGETDNRPYLPYMTAIFYNEYKALELMLKYYQDSNDETKELLSEDIFTNLSTDGENIVHFAVKHSIECFNLVLKFCNDNEDEDIKRLITEEDLVGFTPLMYACEMGQDEIMNALLQAKVPCHIKGPEGVTPLHLAAASGNLKAVELLLKYGHKVDCLDDSGWPPILFAQFHENEDCVLCLMKANPRQIFSLGNLINSKKEEKNAKNAKIIQSTLSSLSYTDAYYSLFNEFIKTHLTLLDQFNNGLFTTTWRRILNFENKVSWLKKRCGGNSVWKASYLRVDRDDILGCTMQQHPSFPPIDGLDVTFNSEPGACLGPKREYFSCIIQEIIGKTKKLFTPGDNQQYCPYPNSYMVDLAMKHLDKHLQDKKSVIDNVTTLPSKSLPRTDTQESGNIIEFQPERFQRTMANVISDEMMLESTDSELINNLNEIESTPATEEMLISALQAIPSSNDIETHLNNTSINEISDELMLSSVPQPIPHDEEAVHEEVNNEVVAIHEEGNNEVVALHEEGNNEQPQLTTTSISDHMIISAIESSHPTVNNTVQQSEGSTTISGTISVSTIPQDDISDAEMLEQTETLQSMETNSIRPSEISNAMLMQEVEAGTSIQHSETLSSTPAIISVPTPSINTEEEHSENNISIISNGTTSLISTLNRMRDSVETSTKLEVTCELDHLHHQFEYIGQLFARVILDKDTNINMQLAKPFIKQILDIPLQYCEELESFDHFLYCNIKDNEMDELEMPWSYNIDNHWNNKVEEVVLNDTLFITDQNKMEYLESISKFKFETSIYKEVKKFKSGFYKYIPRDVICLFNSDEFSLLLNGVGQIDVNDWYNNTLYEHGVTKDCDQVKWFWSLVRSLKQEEKSLLLKFTTGSPCLPIGGFKNLMGLSGLTLFTIVGSQRNDKLPLASTCFNRLSLPRYSSEKMLREKVLIAIRHGCEGFTFG